MNGQMGLLWLCLIVAMLLGAGRFNAQSQRITELERCHDALHLDMVRTPDGAMTAFIRCAELKGRP